jgi:hypothetical protein
MSESEEKTSSKDNFEDVSKKTKESKKKWESVVNTLTQRIKGDLKDIVDIQAEAISYRQVILDEINIYSVKIWKLNQKIKILTKARFEFYATSYQVKTSGTEKLRLIEADLSEYQMFINFLDEHVNYLRETAKNLDAVNYSAKNKIELYNILGGYK